MHSLEKLLEYGILGFYKSCEAIQIFLIDRRENTNKYINFYTIFTFEEKESKSKNKERITNKLIPIDNNFSLGIEKHYFSLKETVDIFNKLNTKDFSEKNIVLKGYSFKLLNKQYIASGDSNRLNKILKIIFSQDHTFMNFSKKIKTFLSILKTNQIN